MANDSKAGAAVVETDELGRLSALAREKAKKLEPAGPPKMYEVAQGTFTHGHLDGEAVRSGKGDVIELTDREARPALAAGTIKLVK